MVTDSTDRFIGTAIQRRNEVVKGNDLYFFAIAIKELEKSIITLQSLVDSINIILTTTGYKTVEDEGVALPQRTVINFVGDGVLASDIGAKTVVSIPGNSGDAEAMSIVLGGII